MGTTRLSEVNPYPCLHRPTGMLFHSPCRKPTSEVSFRPGRSGLAWQLDQTAWKHARTINSSITGRASDFTDGTASPGTWSVAASLPAPT